MSVIKDSELVSKERMQRGGLQVTLMKMVAEQNREKFVEYNCDTDYFVMSEIINGHFHVKREVEHFLKRPNDVLNSIAMEDREMLFKEVERCMKSPYTRVFDMRIEWEGHDKEWYRVFMTSIADESRKVKHIAARLVCIEEQKKAQDLMRLEAERDSLSGVYNHKTYEKICNDIATKYDDGLMFMMIDIDNFKQVNDTYGHHVGDSVIRYVGNVLETAVKGQGVAGRLGGDEFSICIYDVYEKDLAISICIRIKEALKQRIEGIAFTCSIGVAQSNGRKMDFAQLYYEADEAAYFAKGNGKNQFVFADELEKKRADLFQESMQGYSLTDEEILLDQKINYCAIVEPGTKKIIYMNEPARKVLGITLDEARAMYCYELFKGRCDECRVCELHANHVHLLNDEEAAGFKKYIPNGKFYIQSQHIAWKGEPARMVVFADLNDSMHVEQCMEEDLETQDALTKCWSLILESNAPEADYTKVLKILSEYYDADCCTIVTKEKNRYQEIFEYHKNSGQAVAEGLRYGLEADTFTKCEVLLDEDGYMRPRHIEKKLKEYPDIAKELEKGFVHNTIGLSLTRYNMIIGILMIINPKHHKYEYSVLSHIGAFFSADLARKILSDNNDYASNHDVLTRLWSREYMPTWQLQYGFLFQGGMGVFTADIYRLKDINKQLGYESGNDRLVELADLFRKVFEGYSMFRYDDDQVVAICHNVEQKTFEKMVDYAKELIEELDFEVSRGYAWKAEACIDDAYDLISVAEEYLDIHKKFLQKENDAAGKLAKKIENDVLQRVRNGNFRMFLQPKVSLLTGETVGAEGLIRLYEDEKGFIAPGAFIPLLEEHNVVHYIDLFILNHAFQFQKAARDAGKRIVPISVNFSKNTLTYPNLMEYIRTQCELYGAPEGMIRIEITETISNMDHMEVNNIAKALHNVGFSISMDDFGTKYSNMAVLTQFNFDTVKIDRSMIIDIVENEKNQKVLKHTVEMMKDLGMEIVIEGVETLEQVSVLKELGCDVVQGYYFGKPEPEERFYELYMK